MTLTGVKDQHTLHLVRHRPPTSAPAAPAGTQPAANANTGMPTSPFGGYNGAASGGFGGAGRPTVAGFGGMDVSAVLNNPFAQALMQDENFMQNMLENNPRIQRMLQNNPELATVLRNPELMRETMQAMRNPAAMAEMQRNADRALLSVENHPDGWRMLQRMYSDLEDPLADMPSEIDQFQQAAPSPSTPAQPESATPTASAIPNPWAPRGTTQRLKPVPPKKTALPASPPPPFSSLFLHFLKITSVTNMFRSF